jgi:hypothetical protein
LVTKQEGAADGPDWALKPVIVQVPSNLPGLRSADSDTDDGSKSVSTIGSLEDEGFPTSEDQTLQRSNRVRKPVEQFKFEAMLTEILDTTTDAGGAEFESPHSPAPGEIFSMKAIFGDETESPEHPLLAFSASKYPGTLYLHEAQRAPDFDKFRDATVKEIVGQ